MACELPLTRSLLACAVALCAHAPCASAQAVRVDPPHLLLTDTARVGHVTVSNRTSGALDVRVDLLMQPGPCAQPTRAAADAAPPEPAVDAADLLRFAPTRFRLDSGGTQLVRVARVARTTGADESLQLALLSRRASATRLIAPDSNARLNELGTRALVRVPVCLLTAVRTPSGAMQPR